ncbi:MAG: hypothetical protein ACYDIA_08525 [Candidatus Humimicrobiaceae bacterium]
MKKESLYGHSNFVKIAESLGYKKRYVNLIDNLHKSVSDNIFT